MAGNRATSQETASIFSFRDAIEETSDQPFIVSSVYHCPAERVGFNSPAHSTFIAAFLSWWSADLYGKSSLKKLPSFVVVDTTVRPRFQPFSVDRFL